MTGESLFKLQLNQVVTSVAQADYRGRGTNDLIICTRNGDGKCLWLDLNNCISE